MNSHQKKKGINQRQVSFIYFIEEKVKYNDI